MFVGENITHSDRFLGRVSIETCSKTKWSSAYFMQMTVDTYLGSILSNALIAILFGIFKCTNFAEVLYSVSQLDSQLELKEKHYDKVKGVCWPKHCMENDLPLVDQAQNAVLGGCRDSDVDCSDGRCHFHVWGHTERHHLAGLYSLWEHGHHGSWSAVHSYVYGAL